MLRGPLATVRRIRAARHVSRVKAFGRYADWQRRRALGLFPFDQTLSESRIEAPDARSGASALIHMFGAYDYNNMSLSRMVLDDGGLFFDVGANIGAFTLFASENQRAQVAAFEPHPGTFRHLQHNVSRNDRANVSLHHVALSDIAGRGWLTDDLASENHLVGAPTQDSHVIAVDCRRAEDFCRDLGVPTCVKVDVEGFEYDVLTGFGSFLVQLHVILVEDNGLGFERSRDVGTLLQQAGFEGPYAVSFDDRLLSRFGATFEDRAWFSPKYLSRLRNLGFRTA